MKKAPEKIPVIICHDVEPDYRQISPDTGEDWEGFSETVQFFDALRGRLAEVTGAPAHFNWFFRMDPQIERVYGSPGWAAERYGELVARLERAGDEFGLHTHAWRWDEGLGCWVTDHGSRQWVEHCVRTAFDAFRKAFGRPCVSFRFGDHWMNNETLDLLESLGVRFELTVEPGRIPRPYPWDKSPDGWLPDYVRVPRRPYRPSRRDFRTHGPEGGRDLWAIPVSTGKEPGRFTAIKRAAAALGVDLRKRNDTVPLNLELNAPLFRALTESWLDAAEEKYLGLIMRSDACLPARARAHVEANLDYILTHPLAGSFRFTTSAEALALLGVSTHNGRL
ncbi:MAG: hypothetical protein JOZ02_00280 [Acidobacteria bacterium]|nr:hypothetical protein [Acidobacteriota bacterium]